MLPVEFAHGLLDGVVIAAGVDGVAAGGEFTISLPVDEIQLPVEVLFT